MAVPRRTLILLRKLARQVGAPVDDTVRAVTASWLAAWDDLTPAWQAAIAAVLEQYQTSGVWPSPWQVARIEAVARAADRTDRAIVRLLDTAASATADAAAQASKATEAAEPAVIASQTSRTPIGDLTVPRTAIAVALAARQTRIRDLHQSITADSTGRTGSAFRRPPTIPARALAELGARLQVLFDAPLTRAVTVARTEPIDTYRVAAQLVDMANPAVVSGWCWTCLCDRRSCIACWAMHSRRFPADVPGPEGHCGCRCTRLPLVGDNTLPSAEARFRRLSRRDQKAILGAGRYDLFHADSITWGDLAVRRSNPGWRDGFVPRPVADLNRIASTRAQ